MDEIVIRCRKQSMFEGDVFLYRDRSFRRLEIAAESRRNLAFSVAVAYRGGGE
ncbi:hypothetical protein [Rhizobium sp. ZPR3]|uniref:Uncharacterized protein n=2 Tax=unclassified Rhizobium TaxID=2613769 RepID=A0AAU7SGL9_9HYPH